MNRRLCRVICLILLFLPVKAFCADTVIVDAKIQYELANTLFAEKDFSAAAHEYIRFFHLFPDHEKSPEARYQAGVCFFYAGMLTDAARHFEKISASFSDSGFAPDALFKLSEVYLAMDNPARAASVLRDLVTLTQNPDVKDKACFTLGWLLLDRAGDLGSSNNFKTYPVQEAQKYFSLISESGRQKYPIEQTVTSLAQLSQIRQKNPSLAGILSIIPGGGFLYCERYQDALVSFLLNSTLILAAYKSFENDNDFLGGAISFVEAGFYSGNIYGSVASAHKYNKNSQEKAIDNLKQTYQTRPDTMSFHAGPVTDGFALMFKTSF